MSRNYYVLSTGRLKREAQTLYLETAEGRRAVPIEDVDSLYAFGELDLNTKLLNFLSQRKVPLHVFNYYGYYAGTYCPRDYLHSGFLLVHQVTHYRETEKRMALARELVRGAAHSLSRTLAYYQNRRETGVPESEYPSHEDEEPDQDGFAEAEGSPNEYDESEVPESESLQTGDGASESQNDLEETPEDGDPAAPFVPLIESFAPAESVQRAAETIRALSAKIDEAQTPDELRGLEGKMRLSYYSAWRHILREGEGLDFTRRVRRPPDNIVNALISFGNGMLYAACLTELYRTQLTPTISYLHEPGTRRFSLALDMSEIFKPLIVDRAIFTLLNTRQLQTKHFDQRLNYCYLEEAGRKIYIKAFEEKLQTTLYHRQLKRHVSYKRLIRLECYRLIRHLTDAEPYRAFRAWW
jgi:CRISPR/Cas system-associated endonuclease Cas1